MRSKPSTRPRLPAASLHATAKDKKPLYQMLMVNDSLIRESGMDLDTLISSSIYSQNRGGRRLWNLSLSSQQSLSSAMSIGP